MKDAIIFGDADFAKLAHFYLTKDSEYNIVAFTINKQHIKDKQLLGLPILAFEEIENHYPPDKFSMFIAIAYSKVNKVRAKIFSEAKSKGYTLLSYINSKAITWDDLKIGENCFILENVDIQPFVNIGNDVIIWSASHIGHHTNIGDHCFITSHVVISGNVTIEPFCFLGVNSTIRDGINIAKECVIGAGSVILHDTKEKEVYTNKSTELLKVKSNELKHL